MNVTLNFDLKKKNDLGITRPPNRNPGLIPKQHPNILVD